MLASLFQPRGFTPFMDVFSGQVAGEPKHQIPGNTGFQAILYTHALTRQGTGAGYWTVQIWTGPKRTGTLLFEQSIYVKLDDDGGIIAPDGAFPGGVVATRICNGQYVPMVNEPGAVSASSPENPSAPGTPADFALYNAAQPFITIRMPDLPANATSFDLWAAPAPNAVYPALTLADMPPSDDWLKIASGLKPQSTTVVSTDIVGANSLQELWFQIAAVGPHGVTFGGQYRDIWFLSSAERADPQQGKVWPMCGYKGYMFSLQQPQEVQWEDGSGDASQGGFFSAPLLGSGASSFDYITPGYGRTGYKCNGPAGCYFEVISDYWVSVLPDDDIYYSISYLPGNPPPDAQFGQSGEMNVAKLLQDSGDVLTGYSWPQHQEFEAHNYIPDASSPSFNALPNGRQLVSAMLTSGYTEHESLDSGKSWNPVVYRGPNKSLPLFPPEVVMPQTITLGDQRISVGVVNNQIRVCQADDIGPGNVQDLGPAASGAVYTLVKDSTNKAFIVDNTAVPIWESVDGIYWVASPAAPSL